MKKYLILLLAAGAMALFSAGCSSDDDIPQDDGGGNENPTQKFPDITTDFAFEIINASSGALSVDFSPVDKTQTYYCSVMAESDYEKYKIDADLFERDMAYFESIANDNEISVNELLTQALISGDKSFTWSGLAPGTNYIVYAYGLATDGTAKTAVNRITTSTVKYEKVDCSFTIKASEITKTSFHITVTPTNDQCAYYFDILDEVGWQQACESKKENIPAFMNGLMTEYSVMYDMTMSEIWSKISSYGKEELDVVDKYAGDTYYVFAIGIAPDGTTTTDPFVIPVTTESEAPNTFTIVKNSVTQDAASFTITPERREAYIAVIDLAENIAGASDNEIVSYVLGSYNINAAIQSNQFTLNTGYEENNKYSQILVPNKKYDLIIFGYDGVAASTAVIKEEFTTKAASAYDCSFTIKASDVQKNQATLKIKATNENTPFYFDILTANQYATLGGNDEAIKGHATRMMKLRYDESQSTRPIYEWFADNLFRGDFSGGFTDLTPGETYYAYVVGMAADGTFTTKPCLSESFTTISGASSTATYDFKIGQVFDNGDGTNTIAGWYTPFNHDYMLYGGISDDGTIYRSSDADVIKFLEENGDKSQWVQCTYVQAPYGGKAYFFAAIYDKEGIPLVVRQVVDSPARNGQSSALLINKTSHFTQDVKPVIKAEPQTVPFSLDGAQLRISDMMTDAKTFHRYSSR